MLLLLLVGSRLPLPLSRCLSSTRRMRNRPGAAAMESALIAAAAAASKWFVSPGQLWIPSSQRRRPLPRKRDKSKSSRCAAAAAAGTFAAVLKIAALAAAAVAVAAGELLGCSQADLCLLSGGLGVRLLDFSGRLSAASVADAAAAPPSREVGGTVSTGGCSRETKTGRLGFRAEGLAFRVWGPEVLG